MADYSGLLLRRGPTTDRLNFFPLKGEIVYDTDNQVVYVGGLDENDEFKAGGLSVFGDRIKLSETIDITGRENLDILLNTTGAVRLPTGTTAQRPGVQFTEAQNYAKGMIRFNIDTNDFEGFDGTNWVSIGGGGAGENISLTFIADEINRIAGETATTVATDLNTELENKLTQSNSDLEDRVDASIAAGVTNATNAATTVAQDLSRDILADSLLMYDAFRVWQFTTDDEKWFGENNVLSVDVGGLLRNTASAANPRLYYLFSDNTDDINDTGDWVSKTTYQVDDVVTYIPPSPSGSTPYNAVQYKCLVSHTSDVFQTALDLDYWEVFIPTNEKVNADLYKNVAVHIKRVSGSGWSGKLYWDTGTGFNNSITIEDRTTTEDFRILSFDLRDVSSWNGTIEAIQLELGATADDVFDIDWIAIGNEAPANYFAEITEERNTRVVENGLISGQYSLKVDAGGYVVGYGLLATNDPIKGETDSAFIIRAETFKIIDPEDSELVPFVITTDGGVAQTELNSNVKIRGNTIIDGTLSTDQLTVGSTNNFVTGNDILNDNDLQNALRGPTGTADFIDLSLTSNFFLEKNTTTDTPTDISSTGTISYGSDARNVMDYYLPTGKTKGVVLYIHGGGWSSGEKDDPEFLEKYKPAILANGYALLSMNYRLSQDPIDYGNPISGPFNQNADDHAWPAQLNDVKKVLALLMSDDQSVSSDQTEWTTLRDLVKNTAFMVTGESAGGHLAVMGVFEYALDTDGVWPDAVFNNVGPMDLRSSGPDDPNNPFGQAGLNLRATLTENDPDKINSASPAFRLATWKGISNYYTNNTKFYFYANNNDTIVPHTSITPFVEELTQDLSANQVTYLRETVGTPTPANPGNGYLLGDPNPTQYVADHNITFEKSVELAKANSLSGLSTVLVPDSIKITPTKNGALQDSVLSFSTDPSVTLIDDGDSKVLKAIDFEGNESTTVNVSTTFEDTEFSKQSTILLVQSGSSGENGEKGQDGEKGDSGPRGSGRFFREITGSTWSDSEAELAILNAGFDSPTAGDVVTLVSSSGDFTEDRLFDGTDWTEISLLVNGDAVIDGTLSANKLILNGSEFATDPTTGALEINELNANKITSGTIDANRLNLGNSILTSENGILSIDSDELNNAIKVDAVFSPSITVTESGKFNGNSILTDGATITAVESPADSGEFVLKVDKISLEEIEGGGKVTFDDGSIFAFEDDEFRLGEYKALTGIRLDSTAQKAALIVAKTADSNPGVFAFGVGAVGNDTAAVFANNADVTGFDDTWPTTTTGSGKRKTNATLAASTFGFSTSMSQNANATHPPVEARLASYEPYTDPETNIKYDNVYAGVFDGNVVINGDLTVTGSGGGGGGAEGVEGAVALTLAKRDGAANLTANDFIIPSDKNLKRNIVSIDGELAVEALRNVEPKTFQYHDNDRQLLGFIAQDMEQYYPELITTNDDGHQQLSYSMITSVLWKQNQELLKRIEQLEKKLGDS